MGRFGESAWANGEFSRNYVERADVYIVGRRKMFGVVASFFRHFYGGRKGVSVVDLGCGDGVLTQEILKVDASVSATLVDGSQDMLARAGGRLGAYEGIRYVRASFQELLDGSVDLGEFDLAVSSLAVHHLSLEEKAALFQYICGHLSGGGHFVNIDVVLAPSGGLEDWYFGLWKGWMREMQARLGLKDESAEEIITRYKDPASMNRPDTLDAQLGALSEAGFKDVDCYYKDGIFAVFGGRKE